MICSSGTFEEITSIFEPHPKRGVHRKNAHGIVEANCCQQIFQVLNKVHYLENGSVPAKREREVECGMVVAKRRIVDIKTIVCG